MYRIFEIFQIFTYVASPSTKTNPPNIRIEHKHDVFTLRRMQQMKQERTFLMRILKCQNFSPNMFGAKFLNTFFMVMLFRILHMLIHTQRTHTLGSMKSVKDELCKLRFNKFILALKIFALSLSHSLCLSLFHFHRKLSLWRDSQCPQLTKTCCCSFAWKFI